MATAGKSPAQLVFDAIINEWVAHIREIEALVRRIEVQKAECRRKDSRKLTWSFELDLNRWAREGYRKNPHWKSPETGLKAYPSSRMSADALVNLPGHPPVAVEIALVSNVTEYKWIDKINRDTQKLETESEYPGLQIIACFDDFDFELSPDWICWLSHIDIWKRKSSMIYEREILSEGKMLARGWEVAEIRRKSYPAGRDTDVAAGDD